MFPCHPPSRRRWARPPAPARLRKSRKRAISSQTGGDSGPAGPPHTHAARARPAPPRPRVIILLAAALRALSLERGGFSLRTRLAPAGKTTPSPAGPGARTAREGGTGKAVARQRQQRGSRRPPPSAGHGEEEGPRPSPRWVRPRYQALRAGVAGGSPVPSDLLPSASRG